MNKLHCLSLAVSLALPLAANAAEPTLDGSGLGAIRIGMPLGSIPIQLKRPIDKTMFTPSGECFYVHARKGPHVDMMIENGRLTRIDVLEPGISTATGISVGDPIGKVQAAYGAAAVESPDPYDAELPQFTVTTHGGLDALRFGTSDGKVNSIVAGRASSVAYMEGCS